MINALIRNTPWGVVLVVRASLQCVFMKSTDKFHTELPSDGESCILSQQSLSALLYKAAFVARILDCTQRTQTAGAVLLEPY